MRHISKRTLINPLWGALSNEPLLTLNGVTVIKRTRINPLWGTLSNEPLLTLYEAHFQTNPY